jgi:IPT/TIG domain
MTNKFAISVGVLVVILAALLTACPVPPTPPANVTISLMVRGDGELAYAYSAGGQGACNARVSPCVITAPRGGTFTAEPNTAFGSSVTAWEGGCVGNAQVCRVETVNADLGITAITTLEAVTAGDTCARFEPNQTTREARVISRYTGFAALCGDADEDVYVFEPTSEQRAALSDPTMNMAFSVQVMFDFTEIRAETGFGTILEVLDSEGNRTQAVPVERYKETHLQPDAFSDGHYRASFRVRNPNIRVIIRVRTALNTPRPAQLQYAITAGFGVFIKPDQEEPRTKTLRAGTITERLENGTTRIGYQIISALHRTSTISPQRPATGPALDPEYIDTAFNEHLELRLRDGDAAQITLPNGVTTAMLQTGNLSRSRFESFVNSSLSSGAIVSDAFTQVDTLPVDATQRLEPPRIDRAVLVPNRTGLEYSFAPVAGAVEYTATMTSCAPGLMCRFFRFPVALSSTRGTLRWWKPLAPNSTVKLSITASNRHIQEITLTLPAGQWNASRATITVLDTHSSGDAPTITGLSRSSGSANGSGLVINGSRFVGVTGITAGGVPVQQYHVLSDEQIVLTLPAIPGGGAQPIVVNTSSGSSNPAMFTFVPLGASVDFDIAAAFLIQSAQDAAGTIPMIRGKPTALWVWCTTTIPQGTLFEMPLITASATDSSGISLGRIELPTRQLCTNDLAFANGPRVIVPQNWVEAGVTITTEINGDRARPETRSDNNVFAFAPPDPIDVPPLEVTFVPFRMYGETPDTSAANLERMVRVARRVLPVREVDVQVHETMQVKDLSLPGEVPFFGEIEDVILRQTSLLQYLENSQRLYVAFAKTPAQFTQACMTGICGLSFIGLPTSFLYDTDPRYPIYRSETTFVHELGHALGEWHSYCTGSEPIMADFRNDVGCDPNYPFATQNSYREPGYIDPRPRGNLALNLDNLSETLLPLNSLMNGGGQLNISTYTYRNILAARAARVATLNSARVAPQSTVNGVVFTGMISSSGVTLEPPIAAGTPYRAGTGRYTIEGLNSSGTVVVSNQFTVMNSGRGHGHADNSSAHQHGSSVAFIASLPSREDVTAIRVLGMNGDTLLEQTLVSSAVRTQSAKAPYTVTQSSGTRQILFDRGVYSSAVLKHGDRIVAMSSSGELETNIAGNLRLVLTRGLTSQEFVIP